MTKFPKRVRYPNLYAASLTAPLGTRLLMGLIFDRALSETPFSPGELRLARMFKRSPRTVRRWIHEAERRGWIKVVRRGKYKTNRLMLSRAMWRRITGQSRTRIDQGLQGSLFRIGRHLGLAPVAMMRRGVGRGR